MRSYQRIVGQIVFIQEHRVEVVKVTPQESGWEKTLEQIVDVRVPHVMKEIVGVVAGGFHS